MSESLSLSLSLSIKQDEVNLLSENRTATRIPDIETIDFPLIVDCRQWLRQDLGPVGAHIR